MKSGVSKKIAAKLNAMARAIKEREGRTVIKLFLDGVFYRVSPYHHWVTLKQYRIDCIEVQCKRMFHGGYHPSHFIYGKCDTN